MFLVTDTDLFGDDEIEILDENPNDSDIGKCQKKWMPNFLIWEWQEKEGDAMRCSIVINLPSGVINNNNNFSVAVTSNCQGLELEMTWPDFLVNTHMIHKWIQNILEYHPRLKGCKIFLSKHRPHITDQIKSKATILLPFKVLKKIEKCCRFNNEKTKTSFVYLDLVADQLPLQNNDGKVEEI